MHRNLVFHGALWMGLVWSLPTLAQVQPTGHDLVIPSPLVQMDERSRNLQLSAGAQHLSGNYGNWQDVTLRGAWGLPAHTLQGELSSHKRFGVSGTYVAIGDTHVFSDDWYGSAAVGAGDGAFYLPKYRVDVTLNRKFLERRQLVATVGVGYYSAPDGHSDRSLLLGATYYLDAPWIVEGGVRLNDSTPGSVRTRQHFIAATWGRPKADLVTGRLGWGGEGYLAVGPATQLVNFDSREVSLAWRHWFNARTGFVVAAHRYSNPLYRRVGASVGLFYDF